MNDKSFRYLSIKLILMGLSIDLPLIMIDAPFWLTSAVMFIVISPLIFHSLSYSMILFFAYDIIKPILYIWALIVTIGGEQDFLAIAFYIIFGLQIFTITKKFIGTIFTVIYFALEKKNKQND